MSVFDFITSMLCLPTKSLSKIEENTFLLTLPVEAQTCPQYNVCLKKSHQPPCN